MFSAVIAILVLWVVWWIVSTRQPKNFPPGPRITLPVLGNAWELGGDVLKGLCELREKYGKLSGLYLGPLRSVIINDYDLMVEAFSRDEFSGRPNLALIEKVRGRVNDSIAGVIFASGKNWTDMRRFTLHKLRDFGFGKQGMEEMIQEEVEMLCKHLEETQGQPTDILFSYNIAILNALWRVLTGERLSYTDPRLNQIIVKLAELLKQQASLINQVAVTLPWLNIIMEWIVPGYEPIKTLTKIMDLIDEVINEHMQTFQDDSSRDFVDTFLTQQKSCSSDPTSVFKGINGTNNLKSVMLDLIIAGMETTSTTLNWATLVMAKYPDVQKKVRAELNSVTGGNHFLEASDRKDTPYTEAVIAEIQRIGNIVPKGAPHCTTKDTTLGGFFIPKNTQVIANHSQIMFDSINFSNPKEFCPERFLKNGIFVPDPKMIAFGVGKRRCLGETLARMELYKFMTGMIHHFDIVAVPGQTLSLEPAPGATLSPKRYQVMLKARR